MASMPFVSVIIPCLNEQGFVGSCIKSVLANDYPGEFMEVIVVDGRSTDHTREEVLQAAENDNRVRLLDNPSKTQAYALNIGIKAARGQYILRMDAHAVMASDYIRRCITLLETTGADNVGGPYITLPQGNSLQAKIVAALTSNWIIVGGSSFRSTDYEGYADGAGFGAYPKRIFDKIGLFDERLRRSEDNEFNARIRKNGGRIWLTPRVKVYYYSRSTLFGLFKQAFETGKWNVLALILAPHAFQLRHQAPGLILIAWLLGLIGWFGSHLWMPAIYLLLLPAFHILGITVAGVMMAFQHGFSIGLLGVPCAICYHLVYGSGILLGWALALSRRYPSIMPARGTFHGSSPA
ncbi:MAG: glycosyltransferase family 2 protein [Deltaproteobacteria bacterium]|nr:glycosyltransferase family 2 protein [Deltaproteobacteria bacterium]